MNLRPGVKSTFLPIAGELGASLACEVCGQPLVNGVTCRRCGLGLLDLALSSVVDEEDPEPSSGPALPTPTAPTYDHYEICRCPDGTLWELGRGAMGITYKATDTHLGCPVALKIINTGRLHAGQGRARFLREARAAAQLRHPNIASIFHLGLGEANCFYAMEYIEGETLEERVRREGAFSPPAALGIVLQAAQALCLAHQHGFVHRDLKPSNVMLVGGADEAARHAAPAVKLIDFGLVKTLVGNDAGLDAFGQGYFAGTPYYASPEQLAGRAVDVRSDLFSLGMCLWFMLVGDTPASATTLVDGERAPRTWTSLMEQLSRRVPPPVVALVEAMIAPDPACRPQDAPELVAAIQASLARLSRTRQHLWWLALGAVLLVGAAGLAFAWTKGARIFMGLDDNTVAAQQEARLLCAEGEEHLYNLNKPENRRAVDAFTRALARWSDCADARVGLGIAYYHHACRFGGPASDVDRAVENVRQGIALDPSSPKGYRVLGIIRAYQGRPWEGLAQVHHALELDAKFLPAVRDFGMLWLYVGRAHFGLAWALQALKMDPANGRSWLYAGEASAELCADEQAIAYYRRSAELTPMYVQGYCGPMRLYILQGDYAQARREYAAAVAVDPESIFSQMLYAQIDFFGGDYEAAEADYRRLLERDREGGSSYEGSISFLSALGYLRQRKGDFAQAKALLEEAARVHANNSDGPQFVYDLAAIRSVQGRTSDALLLLQRAIIAGWLDYRAASLDPRFEALHPFPEFWRALDDLRKRVDEMRVASERLCARPVSLADYPVQAVKEP